MRVQITSENSDYSGKVVISGAKNSATRILAASLITDSENILYNFPTELVDVKHKVNAMTEYGAQIDLDTLNSTARINADSLHTHKLTKYDYPIRTTYLLAAGLLKRFGKACIPYPGGCNIGNRGYDQHIKVWRNLGCKIEESHDSINIFAPQNGLTPLDVRFDISTIGGTENALISASMISDESHIRDAYVSPEVEDLISYLKATGVKIEVSGNSHIKVVGSEQLKGVEYTIIPDRIEALTWLIFGAISGGELQVKNVPYDLMEIPLIHLKKTGIDIFANDNDALISPDCLLKNTIQPFELACGTHPGVISDMQPFFVLLGLAADGTSRIYDYRYPERVAYLKELNKFCSGSIEWKKGEITVHGPVKFKPANADSLDLRGGMAVLIAAILSKGACTVENIQMAMRGYNKLEEKLRSLGVKLKIE